jgi:hypothetical protein
VGAGRRVIAYNVRGIPGCRHLAYPPSPLGLLSCSQLGLIPPDKLFELRQLFHQSGVDRFSTQSPDWPQFVEYTGQTFGSMLPLDILAWLAAGQHSQSRLLHNDTELHRLFMGSRSPEGMISASRQRLCSFSYLDYTRVDKTAHG